MTVCSEEEIKDRHISSMDSVLGPMSLRFFVTNYLNKASQRKLKGVPQIKAKLSVHLW